MDLQDMTRDGDKHMQPEVVEQREVPAPSLVR